MSQSEDMCMRQSEDMHKRQSEDMRKRQSEDMRNSSGRTWQLLAAAWLVLAGCAPLPAASGGASVPPASGTPVPAPTPVHGEPRRDVTRSSVARDSMPSADALRVLASIPEPLSPAEQVPPPPGTGTVTMRAPAAAYDTLAVSRPVTMPAPAAASDSLRVERAPDNDGAAVPVPSPTQPLGNNPSPTLTMPDTLTPTTALPAAAPPSTSPPPAAATPVSPALEKPAAGECWRVQVAAPEEKAKADSRSAAAQSLLMVPMVITFEKGLYKVRTHDCMTHEAADALRKRAIDSGFDGAFVLNLAPVAPPPAAKPKPAAVHKKLPARKHPAKKPTKR